MNPIRKTSPAITAARNRWAAGNRSMFCEPGTYGDLSEDAVLDIPEGLAAQDSDIEVVVGVAIEPTPVWCGQCGRPYQLGYEVTDALLSACPACAGELSLPG